MKSKVDNVKLRANESMDSVKTKANESMDNAKNKAKQSKEKRQREKKTSEEVSVWVYCSKYSICKGEASQDTHSLRQLV